MQKSMNDYYNNLKGDICKLGLALIALVICWNLAVSTLDNGIRKLHEAAEKYGIELEEPNNVIEPVDTYDKAPIVQNDVSINLDISLISVSLAGLVPMLLLVAKKVSSGLIQKKNTEAKGSVEISKLQ